MQQRCRSALFHPHRHARQRGVYALEWAIIFPVFFMLLYGIICYGLTFLVRESMQFAVEEGARAALRYPVGKDTATWADRKQQAQDAVMQSLDWLPTAIRPTASTVQFTACAVSNTSCSPQTALDSGLLCNAQSPCMVLVSYTIDNYAEHAIAPALPGFGLILPSSLQATASMVIDRELL